MILRIRRSEQSDEQSSVLIGGVAQFRAARFSAAGGAET